MSHIELGWGDDHIETIGGWIEKAQARLHAEEVESPRLCAHLLLETVTGHSRAFLLAHPEKTLTPDQLSVASALLSRRLDHEPMAYLMGKKEFRNRTFAISPGVLIPRPETEGLVDLAIRYQPKARSILDAGTGSGCLALSLLDEFRQSRVFACEASDTALTLARNNDGANGVEWVRSHWMEPFKARAFDLIVSNPPYLTRQEMESLDRQVKAYEPAEALYGGEDGCDHYRLIVPQASECLSGEGILLVEISPTVRDVVRRLMEVHRYEAIEILKDLAGRERYAKGIKRG